jgi:hypothetical protein
LSRVDLSIEMSEPHDFAVRVDALRLVHRSVHRIPRPTSVTIAIRPLCPGNLAERANGRLSQNRPLLELSPLRPKGGKACIRARDSSGVFLNPNSCMGFEPEPSKEGSG